MSRPFGDVLGELAGGTTYDQLGEALTELVVAVRETGKQGKLTLTLTVKANGRSGISVADTINNKLPVSPRGDTLFFTDQDGGLHRNDPQQKDLPLRRVEDKKEERA